MYSEGIRVVGLVWASLSAATNYGDESSQWSSHDKHITSASNSFRPDGPPPDALVGRRLCKRYSVYAEAKAATFLAQDSGIYRE